MEEVATRHELVIVQHGEKESARLEAKLLGQRGG